jgi:uncharacterized protein involved in outer membrane biogenesis
MPKRIISISLLALTGVLVLAALSVNFLVRHNKDFLLGELERAFSRRISADTIDVTFTPFGARLKNFAIAGDSTSSGDLLRATDAQVELRILPLFIGQFRVKKIVLESPLITIVRDSSGRYNYERQAGDENSERDGAKRRRRPSSTKHDSQPLSVASLNISNGTLHYHDLNSGNELTVTQIKLKVSDIETDEPVEIELDAAVMAAKVNLRFNSRIGPTAGMQDYRDFPIDGAIDADALDLGKVNRALPQFRKALPRHLRFDGIYDIKDLKFKGALNNLSLKGAISGTDASVRFE